jgi:hypothetical protein
MERGDLAVFTRPHYVIVLEGVLVTVEQVEGEKRHRWSHPHFTTHWHWLDAPLRRLATNKRRFPDVGAEIVTFLDQEATDQAAAFLDAVPIDYDSLSYIDLQQFCSLLPYRDGLQVVYDSDPSRLNRFGQMGREVIRGEDFT